MGGLVERMRYTVHEFVDEDLETGDEDFLGDDWAEILGGLVNDFVGFERGRGFEWGFSDLNVVDNGLAITFWIQ